MGRPKARYNEAGEKECTRCRVFKPVTEYNQARRTWDRREPTCKTCRSARYQTRPKPDRREHDLTRRKRLPQTPHQDGKKLCNCCREWRAVEQYTHDSACWDGLRPYCKACCRQRRHTAVQQRGYWLQGRHSSIQAQLRANLRTRLWHALKGTRKAGHTLDLIGCTIDQLKQQFESQFEPGMSWDNYGLRGWHIGHIKDCCSFDLTDEQQQRECFHHTNIHPEWARDNLRKPHQKRKTT